MADDDDDPQLHSMRAAWRSLPDEDPPERGLAELMAAARRQADVMAEARAPWWKRALAMLMKPPVLALASVLVLLGGIFAVTTSHKGVSPEPSAVDQTELAPAAAPPPVATPPVRLEPAMPSSAGLAQPTTSPPAIASPRSSMSVDKPKPSPPEHHAAKREAPPPPPAPSAAAPVSKDDADEDRGGDAPALELRNSRAPAAKSAAPDAASSPKNQLDAQLFAQCRSAAARGDCETAKKIAQRIQTADADYYTQTVATDAAIAKCLSE
jgi:hypothetical protein